MKNYNIAAKKRDGEIIFLRKIVRGGTDDSYGIEVAQLAGVPKEVLTRARAILKELEAQKPQSTAQKPQDTDKSDGMISLGDISAEAAINRIKSLDINTLTPIEAMGVLYELKKSVDN